MHKYFILVPEKMFSFGCLQAFGCMIWVTPERLALWDEADISSPDKVLKNQTIWTIKSILIALISYTYIVPDYMKGVSGMGSNIKWNA